METAILGLVTSFFGALGFSLLFNVKKEHLLAASLGGILTWGVYLIATKLLSADDLVASVFSGAACEIYSQILARWKKAPALIFSIPALVSLIPGGALYRTMHGVIDKDWSAVLRWGGATIQITFGIAIGMSFILGLLHIQSSFRKKQKKI
jgi:uncharacterized membrane protein YjjB (DUF3815 family)